MKSQRTIQTCLGVAAGVLLLQATARGASTRAIAVDTDEVTEAAIALSPDGSTLVFTMLGHLFRLPVAGGTAEQLTYGPYYDGDPAFSPDGSKVAFVSDRGAREGNEFAIFVLETATKQVRQLTREPFAIRPTFTASGDEIDYLGVPPQPAFPGSLILRRIPESGGEPKTLRAVPEQYRSIFRRADGRTAWTIAELKPGAPPRTRIEMTTADGTIEVMATCDGILERVEASPAGDGVFARRTKGGGSFGAPQVEDLVFINTGDDAVRSIAPVESKRGPRPRIAVAPASLFVGDAGHLVRVDAASGARVIVPMRAHVKLEIENPVSPTSAASGRSAPVIVNPLLMTDGSLVFEAAGRLWKQSPGGAPAQRVENGAAHPRAFESSPALSPDGKRLAFIRTEGTKADLLVMELATGASKTIATSGGYSQPAWSADGSRIVFVEAMGFSAAIVSVRSDGESRAELGKAGFWSARPNLSADGQWLYTTANVSGVGNIFRQKLGDGPGPAPEPMTTFSRHASDGLVSPDGKWLAFRRNKEIWIARMGDPGGAAGPLGESGARRFAEEGGDGFSFAADSSALVYAVGGHVYRQPAAGGARAEIPIHLDLPHPQPKPICLRNVRVLDFNAKGFGPPTSVFIADGRIAWIGSEEGGNVPPETEILDAAGKFAIPGLFEMHAHASGANPEAFIAYGVTSVRDTGGSIVGSQELVDRAEAGGDPIPRYFFSGEIFEGEHPYWGDGFLQIQNEDDARAYVRRFKAAGASFIKVYPSLPWPLQLAAADEARSVGLPVVGHGMSVNEITRSVTHGFASIEHTVFPLRIYDDVIRMLAASDTRWDPTLAVVGGDSQLLRKDPARLSDPKLVALTPQPMIETAKAGGYEKDFSDAELNAAWKDQLESVREAHKRGVKFAVGTDAPNPACFYGASLHWEMEFFAAAGIPPIEVLRIATAGAAKTVGASELGVIAPGKLADLVLLDANPLENIKNTQSIWRTVKGGWIFDPLALKAPG